MKKNTKVAFGTLVVSVVVLALKTKAYYTTNSVGALSDALETVVNVLTAVVALYAVKIAAEPADEDHPYGHGKLEYFSAAFEGGLIFFAALAIIFQSAKSFFVESTLSDLGYGSVYLIAASLINLLMGLYLVRYGKKHNSEALKASGKHILADVITSVGVLLGLFFAEFVKIQWVDSLVGLIVGIWLLYEAYKILRDNSGALMDAANSEVLTQLAQIINRHKVSVIIDIHNLKIIRSGHFHHIDAHIVVPEFLDVAHVHELTEQFEKQVVNDYRYDGEIAFHIDPCKRSFCRQCNVLDCKIRLLPFEALRPMTREHLTKGPQYSN